MDFGEVWEFIFLPSLLRIKITLPYLSLQELSAIPSLLNNIVLPALLNKMPLRLSTWTSMFMISGLFNQVSSSQADLDGASIDVPQDYDRICPLPICERCPSNEDIRAPGVGFALESSHGAAVVRLHDGTYQRIALIEGDALYTALLRRLATGPKNRTPDHFDSNWKKL
ncbi:hypothetical protein EAF04_002311 [Stromatinia cepivora]|nr:hypothetical protein EAF04_002311 [Stromatinia cepivora]